MARAKKKNLTQAEVAGALAKQLAAAQRGQDAARKLAKLVVDNAKLAAPIRSNVCTHGICVDFETPELELSELLAQVSRQRPRHIEVFPLGIVVPDKWRVSVTYGLED